ncbi:uncharacterized protein [Rutidosis leptorrhynchoides]|uniref:uncharacterized protein n=1 Tax=Rutidosis leptorrhynchoides TaxID=125765 RepID=UPI003A99D55E
MRESDFNRSLSSTTWFHIVNAGNDMEEFQISLRHSFVKSIGSGDKTAFWLEHWIGQDKLCNLFPRIFRLETVREVSIKDRIKATDSGLMFEWSWSREPNGRTNSELQAMIDLLSGFSFANCPSDTWSWGLASNGTFTVKKLTNLLESNMLDRYSSQTGTLRNSLVPKKVEIFIWRVKKKRIPVRVELDKRDVDLHSLRCPLCDDGLESVEHSLVLCDRVRDLWTRIFKWWGIRISNPYNLCDLVEGINTSSMSEKGKRLWQAIVWIGLYHIWCLRNKTVFENKSWNIPMALSEIQSKTFEWIATRDKKHTYEWLNWITNPGDLLSSL